MDRRDWWATVGILAGLFVAWFLFPRYITEIPIREGLGAVIVRTDRWTGRVEWMRLTPEQVRRYAGGTLTSNGTTELHDTSFDGDEMRLRTPPVTQPATSSGLKLYTPTGAWMDLTPEVAGRLTEQDIEQMAASAAMLVRQQIERAKRPQ